jgi:hypothetical protein
VSAACDTRSSHGCDVSVATAVGVRLVGHRIAGPIHNDFSAYIAESLYYGRTGYRLEQLDKQHIDPLMSRKSGRKKPTSRVVDTLALRTVTAATLGIVTTVTSRP